jgi:hypothetical protein
MCGDRRISVPLKIVLLCVAVSLPAASQTPQINSLQAGITPASPANVTSITIGSQPNGFYLFLNGNFAVGANEIVNWVDPTNGNNTTLPIQGSPTTTQIVAFVGPGLHFAANPSTVQVSVTENGNPSNVKTFLIVPQPKSNSGFPNAFVGSSYGPVLAISGGTPPFQAGGPGSLPPGITLNSSGQLVTATTVQGPPGLYTYSPDFGDFWGAGGVLNVQIQSIGTPTFGPLSSSATFTYPYGVLTTLGIVVNPVPANPPFGPNIIRFLDNNTVLGTVSVTPAAGLAVLNNVFLTTGVHNNIRVLFLGDQNWQATGAGPFTITVTQQAPDFTATGTPVTGTYGGTMGASTVSMVGLGPPALQPTGSVTLSVGSTTIATINNVNPNGVLAPINLAGIQLPAAVPAGTSTLNFAYSGDINYTPFTFGLPLVVNRAQSTLTLAIATNPIPSGQNETLTATAKAPGLGTPSGNVVFLDGGNPLPNGTVALNSSGIATYSTNSLSIGVHPLSVSYGGDNNFLGSQSGTTNLTVTPAPLAFTTKFLPGGTLFQAYSTTVGVTGGQPPYNITATGLPSGLNLNSQTGVLSGSPGDVGTFNPTFTVTDSAGGRATAVFSFTIVRPPVQISTPSRLPDGTVGVGYSATIGTIGGTDPITFSATGTLPPGISFVGNSGLVTGTPTTIGTYTFTVRAVDGANTSDVRDFVLTIKPAPLSAPGGSNNPTGSVGTPINIDFGCTGGVPPYTFSVTGSLPPGVTFANCILSGTPTTPGTFTIHILVTDSARSSITRDVTLTIASPTLALPGGKLPDGQVGVSYTAKVTATGGVPPYTYTGANLPDGLSLSTAGDITGTPTTAGPFSFRVTVRDSSPATTAPVSVSATYTVTIVPPTLAFGPATLPDGVVGVAYSGSLTATGGVKPYQFSASGLPPGLSAATDGTIGGTPTTAGSFTVNANVTDAAQGTARQTYTIKIAPRPLVISTASAPNGTVGTAYSASFAATGGTPPYTFSASGQPSALTMSAAGTLSGTPNAPGNFTVTVTIKDADGTTATKQFPITISLPPSPPLNFGGISTTVNPAQQPRVSVSLGSPFPVDVLVTLSLSFQADSGPADPAVVFSTGGTSATITIPAGSLNGVTDVGIQTGTVAGTITITAKLTAAGSDVTPSPAPVSTTRVAAGAPVIVSATGMRTATGFTITVVGYVSDREMTTAAFGFNGASLGTTSLTVNVDTIFAGWLSGSSPPSAAFGSQFTYTQPFTVNGTNTAITTVTVTLSNRIGASNTATVTLQ